MPSVQASNVWADTATAMNSLWSSTIATPEADANFYKGKMFAFRFFYGYELPKIEGLAARLFDSDGLTLEMKEEFFAD